MRSRVNGTLKLRRTVPLTNSQKIVAELVLTACQGCAVQFEVTALARTAQLSLSTTYRILTSLDALGVILRLPDAYAPGPHVYVSRPATDPTRIRAMLGAKDAPMTTLDDLFAGLEDTPPAPAPAPAPQKAKAAPKAAQPFQEIAARFIALREEKLGRKMAQSQRGIVFKHAKDLLARYTAEEIEHYWTFAMSHQPDKLADAKMLAWLNPDIATYIQALREERATHARRTSAVEQRIQGAQDADQTRREAFRVRFGAPSYDVAAQVSSTLDRLHVPARLREEIVDALRDTFDYADPDLSIEPWVYGYVGYDQAWPELLAACNVAPKAAPTVDDLMAHIAKRKGATQ